jgi:predicted nucleic acid-binding protein
MNFVIDTSALVALSGIHRLDLPHQCCGLVAVPTAVRYEIIDQGSGWIEAAEAQAEIRSGKFLRTTKAPQSESFHVLRARLGAGEAEAIELGRTMKMTIILDDHDARKEALKLKLPITGSLGILIQSRQLGYIDRIAPLIEGMERNGIYLSPKLTTRILTDLGESP